jgi:hypothetical protein
MTDSNAADRFNLDEFAGAGSRRSAAAEKPSDLVVLALQRSVVNESIKWGGLKSWLKRLWW